MPWKLFSFATLVGSLWFFFHELLPVSVSPDEPLIRVKRGDKYGFINAKGQVVVPFRWNFVSEFDTLGVATFLKEGKMGEIDSYGNSDGLWGAIDRTGNILIEPIWNEILEWDSRLIQLENSD